MSVEYLCRWSCDSCSGSETTADAYMPEGWVHTMDGRDLCGECKA